MISVKKPRPSVLIVATGGTIESLYYPQGTKFPPEPRDYSLIPEILSKNKFNYPYEIVIPFMKDSRFFDSSDLDSIFEIVKNTNLKNILISHGTQTMADTHNFLKSKQEELEGKTVVLFGANIRSDQPNSDAGINLGFALGACLYAPNNIYIAMNGILIKSQSCKIGGTFQEK